MKPGNAPFRLLIKRVVTSRPIRDRQRSPVGDSVGE